MNYKEFIKSKKHTSGQFGFKPLFIPYCAFDFQKYIIEKSIKKGRIGVFADTGLGKTLMSLTFALNIVMETNKRVLILTPLAVGFQFLQEAKDRNITDDISQTIKGELNSKIIICNYERLHYLDPNDFIGVLLDESSILKNFKGQIKNQITSFVKKVPYRFLTTATPSPNDFIELGTSSEALGYMGYMDMLTKFFKNNQNTADSNNKNIGEKFYLKPHAENAFFQWVNSWSIMVKKPSDIGFSDEMFKLPELVVNNHIVKNDNHYSMGSLFAIEAKTMTEIRNEQRATEEQRCERAIELAQGKTSVYWCNTNKESALLKSLDNEAIEIIGSQSIEKKEEILKAFSNGDIKRIITKAKITGMGLNWQHCNHSVFFPTWSYEQYYQAIRRFWRFGQTNSVHIDLVLSEGMTRVMEALKQKTVKAEKLYENLVRNVNEAYIEDKDQELKSIIKANF